MIFLIGKRVSRYCLQLIVCDIFMQYQIKYIDYLAHVGKGNFIFHGDFYLEYSKEVQKN